MGFSAFNALNGLAQACSSLSKFKKVNGSFTDELRLQTLVKCNENSCPDAYGCAILEREVKIKKHTAAYTANGP
jgi:hypothetical protein